VPARRRKPLWLTVEEIVAMHDEQIMLFGGNPGLLKPGALEATVSRPLQIHHYDPDADLPRLAAVYLDGLIKAHVFVDGNKRIGLAAMLVFLVRNGAPLHVSHLELFDLVLGLATSRMNEEQAASWIRERLR
jgi:death-on-curing protein